MSGVVPAPTGIVYDSIIGRQVERIGRLAVEERIRVAGHSHRGTHRVRLRTGVRYGDDAWSTSVPSLLKIVPVLGGSGIGIRCYDHHLGDAFQAIWIEIVHRLISDVRIKVDLFRTKPYWIFLDESAGVRIVVSGAVVIQIRLRVEFTSGVAEEIRERAGRCRLISKRIVGVAWPTTRSCGKYGRDLTANCCFPSLKGRVAICRRRHT